MLRHYLTHTDISDTIQCSICPRAVGLFEQEDSHKSSATSAGANWTTLIFQGYLKEIKALLYRQLNLILHV